MGSPASNGAPSPIRGVLEGQHATVTRDDIQVTEVRHNLATEGIVQLSRNRSHEGGCRPTPDVHASECCGDALFHMPWNSCPVPMHVPFVHHRIGEPLSLDDPPGPVAPSPGQLSCGCTE